MRSVRLYCRFLFLTFFSLTTTACAHQFAPPIGWTEHCNYPRATPFALAANDEKDPVAKELLLRVDAEQKCMLITARASTAEREKVWPKIEPIQEKLLRENERWLKDVLKRNDLLDTSKFGQKVSQGAWLIIQHADHDREWQRDMLLLIEKLYQEGKIAPEPYALMTDRVAVNFDQLQTFGSQGKCDGNGSWKPKPIDDEVNVDQRRKTMRLEPMVTYIKRFRCD